MKILLKTELDDTVVTVYQVPTMRILEGWELPDSTDTNIEIGDLVEDLIDGLDYPNRVLNSQNIIEQTIEIAWLRQAISQERDETGLRHCLRGIRIAGMR
jgi:hypothetical protein